MSPRDAFEGEMGSLRDVSPEDAERLLANAWQDRGVPSELREVAAFLRSLPAAVAVQPGPGVESLVVPRVAEAARAASFDAAHGATARMKAVRGRWSVRRRVAAVAVAVALVPASMVGLAFAGVTLPDPARDAFESVGIELPNQSNVDEESSAGTERGRNGGEAARSRNAHGSEGGGSDEQSQRPGVGGGASGNHGERGHRKNGGSQGRGPESTPPGHGATPPGQGGVPPGQGAPPPGHEVVPPSEGGVPPGQADTTPDKEVVPPGQGGVPPGQAKPN